MTQLSNVPMQPNPSAVERPQTLIEKLEQERGYYLQEYQSCLDSHDVVNAIDSCINIVEAHSQETCNWRDNRGTALWECHYGGDYTGECGIEWNMPNNLWDLIVHAFNSNADVRSPCIVGLTALRVAASMRFI